MKNKAAKKDETSSLTNQLLQLSQKANPVRSEWKQLNVQHGAAQLFDLHHLCKEVEKERD